MDTKTLPPSTNSRPDTRGDAEFEKTQWKRTDQSHSRSASLSSSSSRSGSAAAAAAAAGGTAAPSSGIVVSLKKSGSSAADVPYKNAPYVKLLTAQLEKLGFPQGDPRQYAVAVCVVEEPLAGAKTLALTPEQLAQSAEVDAVLVFTWHRRTNVIRRWAAVSKDALWKRDAVCDAKVKKAAHALWAARHMCADDAIEEQFEVMSYSHQTLFVVAFDEASFGTLLF